MLREKSRCHVQMENRTNRECGHVHWTLKATEKRPQPHCNPSTQLNPWEHITAHAHLNHNKHTPYTMHGHSQDYTMKNIKVK